jgi:hypothetical protein
MDEVAPEIKVQDAVKEILEKKDRTHVNLLGRKFVGYEQ